MFIRLKKHNQIVCELRKELVEAKDLKNLLNEIISRTGISTPKKDGFYLTSVDGSIGWGGLNLGDSVLVYVDDILGGKVIKQEATKAIRILPNGEVQQGLTKEKPDKGFTYKLIREKFGENKRSIPH